MKRDPYLVTWARRIADTRTLPDFEGRAYHALEHIARRFVRRAETVPQDPKRPLRLTSRVLLEEMVERVNAAQAELREDLDRFRARNQALEAERERLNEQLAGVAATACGEREASRKRIAELEGENKDLLDLLRAVLPYAESRAEDLVAEVERLEEATIEEEVCLEEKRSDAQTACAKAWDAVERARAATARGAP